MKTLEINRQFRVMYDVIVLEVLTLMGWILKIATDILNFKFKLGGELCQKENHWILIPKH